VTEPRTPLSEEETRQESARLIETAFRDDTPLPRYGDAPPVSQPGRAPMSAKAVDDTARMIGASVVIAVTGGSTTAILWASQLADPVVVALVFGAPTTLALAIARLLRRAKHAVPAPTINNYMGTVHQDLRQIDSHTRGLWARTNNQQ
jgi:hypothetical protein